MLDFGTLPPEINSGRMYSGPGSGPMIAAAAAWDALAAELSAAASGCGSIISELAGDGWLGPASLAMATAAAPYVVWLHSTSVRAERTAVQAKEAATAYELAFAMTVPPPVIAANRSLLMALIATNFFGQNAPAIAAAEAHYAEMWLQDATAMYGYAGSLAAASQLTPFQPPQSSTGRAGLAGQSVAVAHAAGTAVAGHPTSSPLQAAPALLSSQSLIDIVEHVPNVMNSVLSTSNAVTSGRGIFIINERLAFQAAQELKAPLPSGAQLMSAGCTGLGRASLVGNLSVPPGWLTAAPEIRSAAAALPNYVAGVAEMAPAGSPPVAGSVFSQSVLGMLARHGSDPPRATSKPVIVRSPAAG